MLRTLSNLSEENAKQVKEQIFSGFNEWQGYHKFIAPVFDEILEDAKEHVLDSFLLKYGAKKFLSISAASLTKDEKSALYEARVILDAIYVLLLFQMEEIAPLKWNSLDELHAAYPQFQQLDGNEKQLLLNFRNVLRVSLVLIPAARNKKTIMAIAGRLQGKPHDYVTGGGQKDETSWRVQIYEREGNIQAQPRPERKPKMIKRSISSGSESNQHSDQDPMACAAMIAFHNGIDGINIHSTIGYSSSTSSECCSEVDFLEVYTVLSTDVSHTMADEKDINQMDLVPDDTDLSEVDMQQLLDAINFDDSTSDKFNQHQNTEAMKTTEQSPRPSLFCGLSDTVNFICNSMSTKSASDTTEADDDVSIGSRRSRESNDNEDCAAKRMRISND